MWMARPIAGDKATSQAPADRSRQATSTSGAIRARPFTRVRPARMPSNTAYRWRRRSLNTNSQLARAMKTPSL
jgi:hypothetical protein